MSGKKSSWWSRDHADPVCGGFIEFLCRKGALQLRYLMEVARRAYFQTPYYQILRTFHQCWVTRVQQFEATQIEFYTPSEHRCNHAPNYQRVFQMENP